MYKGDSHFPSTSYQREAIHYSCRGAYRMVPDAGSANHIPTSRIPFDICEPIMLVRIHQHQVCGQVFLTFWLLALVVKVVEIYVEVLRDRNCGNNHESAFRRPVYGVAILLFYRSDELKISSSTRDLFWTEERNGGFGGNIRARDSFTGG